jgi:uncharacterized protein YeaO (DUF488 family)
VARDKVDAWEKQLGTPPELIKQWKVQEITWPQLRRAYLEAIKDQRESIAALAARAQKQTVTLLCGCKDPNHCHRTILAELIDQHQARSKG